MASSPPALGRHAGGSGQFSRVMKRRAACALITMARIFSLLCLLLASAILTSKARAQSESTLAERIEKVISRPEFAHANFGIEFYSLDTGKILYALNADKLFVPASTTKILTEAALPAKLAANYHFHTPLY